jgi:hypothetical protein
MTVRERKEKVVSQFRDMKLSVIDGSVTFGVDASFVTNDSLDFIVKNFPNDILTGSVALRMFGLLDRNSEDIDIIIDDSSRYTGYISENYGDDEVGLTNRLGVKRFTHTTGFFIKKKRTHNVDFFENKNASFLTYSYKGGEYKIQSPLEILQYKVSMIDNSKHLVDLEYIFNCVTEFTSFG